MRRGSHHLGETAAVFVVVFVAYAAGAAISWSAFGAATVGPAFFPPAGVSVAALLLTRRTRWPAVLAAMLAAEVLVDLRYGEAMPEIAGYAVANLVEPVVGAALVRRWCGGRPDLRRRNDLALFVAGAGLLGPLVGGLIGGTNVAVLHEVWWPAAVLHWVAGDGIGVLVVATPILLWHKQSDLLRTRPWETTGVLAAAAAVSVGAFWHSAPPSMLVLPVLAWAALRLDMLGAALAGAVVAFVANVLTSLGRGPFSDVDMTDQSKLVLTQVFIAINVLVALLIAQEASARLEAVREREVERRERLRLVSLSRLALQLSAALTPADIGRALEDQLLNDAGAKAFNLGLVGPDGRTLQWVTMAGYPQSVLDRFGAGVALDERGLATDAVRTGRHLVIPTRSEYEDRYPDMVEWVDVSDTESMVAWPFSSGGEPIGVLVLAWSEHQPLDAAQLAYISAVSTMVSQALVRARIYVDEHARAAVLQDAVLPSSPADSPGLEVCITYEPADTVQGLGGDWYDVMALPENRTYFAVGDVVGHGLPAVEDMAQLRSAGRVLAHHGLTPAQLLTELNGFTRDASQGRFATMAVVVFDAASGTLSYCLAGHPPPLLRRAATGDVIRLSDARGLVLGPIREGGYSDGRLRVEPGDILLMYTDGLVERRDMDVESGITRAQQMIGGWGAAAVLPGACERLHEMLAPRPRADDVCIVAVRFSQTAG